MSRMRRVFLSGQVYEFGFRAKEGLPLPTWEVMNLIIRSALARTQRDNKVTLCHHMWMGNHVHIIAVIHDSQDAVDFMQEVQKKLTESIKRLLGQSHLNIWEGTPMMAVITDPAKVQDRIAYLYSNPASADLVDAVEEYPGVSSWSEYQGITHTIEAKSTTIVPWVRQPFITKLKRHYLSPMEDRAMATSIANASSKKTHELNLYPNAWMKTFDIIAPKDVEECNNQVMSLIREKEANARGLRGKKRVLGAERLRRERIFKAHTPKERRGNIIVLSSDIKLRVETICYIKAVAEEARDLYEPWTNGVQVQWPPGVFRPPLRPVANCIQMMEINDDIALAKAMLFG